MNFKKLISLHLRTGNSLAEVAREAVANNLPFFQFFLINHETGKYIHVTAQDIDDFNQTREQANLLDLYIHTSYWINPSTGDKRVLYTSRQLLKKELELATNLHVPYVVLHAGSASNYPATDGDSTGKVRALETLVKTLDKVLKHYPKVTILLENSAYGGKTLGNSLQDFAFLKDRLMVPERVAFCLDTAHAYAYDYDVKRLDEFLVTLDATLGLNNIKLIHFNDLESSKGSMQDHHAFPGKGSIGAAALKNFLFHESLVSVPKIIELPACSKDDSLQSLATVLEWK